MESIWSLYGVHVESMWSPGESMWSPGESMWSLCGVHVESMWSLCGVQGCPPKKGNFLYSTWSPVESMWSYGVHMESMGECKVHDTAPTLEDSLDLIRNCSSLDLDTS
jgi:hypothetical protein